MSFTICSTFSPNYQSLGSVQAPSYRAQQFSSVVASVYAGAGGSGSWISMSHSISFRGGIGSGGLATGMAGGLAGKGGIQNEKETKQSLNDHLASYLDRIRSLETENWKLESKIREHLEKKGPQNIEDLRAQIFTNTVDNACIILQIEMPVLLLIDFRVKYETELAMRQPGLHKVTDDTSITRLQLETEIEALKEELLFMKKNHEEEVKGPQAQIASSGLMMEVDAPKSQDLAKIMKDIRVQYNDLGQKNRDKLDKYWFKQIEKSTTVVTTQSTKEYKAVPNIKVKLEAEIATYRHLLEDGEDFSLGDALDSSNSMQTIQKTTTRQIMDGKVVSETNNTNVLRH
ncbi:Keratin, type I cytoskeletal 18 [Saguinus oedipus]|uniref:Keratin, type I cytoskeletal 18 n=1 Tax=Saguinus oedipus TaxID=9490 RepID=A0ABQ9W0Z6_SAGOE|nr:Keratin, type I cytoskeletal 18 [Saguinus oedipus]